MGTPGHSEVWQASPINAEATVKAFWLRFLVSVNHKNQRQGNVLYELTLTTFVTPS